jgi:hypothetical protein
VVGGNVVLTRPVEVVVTAVGGVTVVVVAGGASVVGGTVSVVVVAIVPRVVAVEVAVKLGPGTSTSTDLETVPGSPAGSAALTVSNVRAEGARCRPVRVTA